MLPCQGLWCLAGQRGSSGSGCPAAETDGSDFMFRPGMSRMDSLSARFAMVYWGDAKQFHSS
jgi:hypothetical protein